MSNRPGRPPETPWLMPYLTVQDAAHSLDFYERAFGFTRKEVMPGQDGRVMHASVQWQDAIIMFGPECPTQPCKAPASSGVASPVNLYIYCEDVDALFARATAAGARADMPPADMFWGDRMCKVTDPDGHGWCFATHKGPPARH